MKVNVEVLAMQNLLANPQFSWGGSYIYEEIDWLDSRPKPTKEAWEAEKDRLIAYQPFQNCKDQAKSLLAKSDWSTLPDVQTQLLNYQDFVNYRIQLRNLVINPVENPVFPSEPEARWK